MIAVLDASVAIALVVEEAGSEAAAAAIADCEVVVPDLFWAEVAGALDRRVRARRIEPSDAASALAALRALILRSQPMAPLASPATALAQDLDNSVHDCIYLAAALAEDAQLLTADRELHAAAVAAGYGPSVRLVG